MFSTSHSDTETMAGTRPAPVVRDAPKLFRERMARENRTEEFDKLIASYVAGGKPLPSARAAARTDMGFVSLSRKVDLFHLAQVKAMHDRRKKKQYEYQKAY